VEDDCFSFMDLEKALGSKIKSVKNTKRFVVGKFWKEERCKWC
jgi:hypothetical protein